MYNENWDMLYRDSKSLPIKRRGEQEAHLIFENNYDEVNNGSSQYIIERYIHLGANLIAITDSENYYSYFELDRYYHKSMTGNWNE